MDRLAAVRFNSAGKYYYFSTDLDVKKGDKVVVETVRGLEMGEIITDLADLSEFKLDNELKRIKRVANRADIEVYNINKIKAQKSFEICKEIIAETNLDMHLINCEYTLDASKVIFMYTSDERVDFRDLLKKLASVFKCRIELRQVGPRDKAKIVGGIGNCGLPLCCNSFLGEFDGVSINMAKNQLLAINIDKISGVCGRLLCCLKYEDESYKEVKKKFPKIGSFIRYEDKQCKVVGLNVISDLVKIDSEGSILFIPLSDIDKKSAPKKERRILEELAPKKEKKHDKPKQKKPRQQHKQKQYNQKPRTIKGNNPKGKKDERRN